MHGAEASLTGLLCWFHKPVLLPSVEHSDVLLTDGPQSMAHTLRVIPHCSFTLVISCIKVAVHSCGDFMLTNASLEGNFIGAEPHLLSSGTRDSARLLAQVYSDWAKATNTLGSHAGIFALRGIIPYARRFHKYCWSLTMYICIDICSMATSSLHVLSLRALSPTSPHPEDLFPSVPPVTRSYLPRTLY